MSYGERWTFGTFDIVYYLSGVYTGAHVRRTCTPNRCTAYMYDSVNIHRTCTAYMSVHLWA